MPLTYFQNVYVSVGLTLIGVPARPSELPGYETRITKLGPELVVVSVAFVDVSEVVTPDVTCVQGRLPQFQRLMSLGDIGPQSVFKSDCVTIIVFCPWVSVGNLL